MRATSTPWPGSTALTETRHRARRSPPRAADREAAADARARVADREPALRQMYAVCSGGSRDIGAVVDPHGRARRPRDREHLADQRVERPAVELLLAHLHRDRAARHG